MVFALIALSLFLPILAGWFVVQRLAPDARPGLHCGLGIASGMAIAGSLYFLALLLTDSPRAALAACESGLAFVAVALWITNRRRGEWLQRENAFRTAFPWVFAAIALIIAIAFLFATDLAPHGEWDAFVMWNMRARLISTSEAAPLETIVDPAFSGSHPDYPLLLPSLVSRGWQYADPLHRTPAAPITLAALFGLAAILITTAGIEAVSTRAQSWIAGCVLLSTPLLINVAASQYADIVICCFMTAAVILYTIHDLQPAGSRSLPILAGVAAAAAACTKNEGILFLTVLLAARFVRALMTGAFAESRREGFAFLLGAALGLLTLGIFKFGYSPANDTIRLMTLQAAITRIRDTNLNREIVNAFRGLLSFGEWSLNPIPLLGLHAVIAWSPRSVRTLHPMFTAAFVLAGMLFGYYCVYLLSPYDLESHVISSLNRLLLQLWPTVLVLYSVLIAPGTWSGEHLERPRNVWLKIAAAVLIVAATVAAQSGNSPRPAIDLTHPPHLDLNRTEITYGQSYSIKVTGVRGPQVYISYSIDGKPMGQFGAYLGSDGTVVFEVSDGTPKGIYRFHAIRPADSPAWTDFDNTAELTVK